MTARAINSFFIAFFIGWLVSYSLFHVPANFLWTCNVAFILAALATLGGGSRLVFSICLILVAVADGLWLVDVLGRLLTGRHWLGGTAYMFSSEIPLHVRLFSLEHVFLAPFLVYKLSGKGYDSTALRYAALLVPVVYYLTWLLADPASEVNWVWGLWGNTQAFMPGALYPLLAAFVFVLVLVVPAHFLAKRFLSQKA